MHEYIIHDSFHDPYIMFLQEKKKKFTLSPLKRVFFSPARKLGGLSTISLQDWRQNTETRGLNNYIRSPTLMRFWQIMGTYNQV